MQIIIQKQLYFLEGDIRIWSLTTRVINHDCESSSLETQPIIISLSAVLSPILTIYDAK